MHIVIHTPAQYLISAQLYFGLNYNQTHVHTHTHTCMHVHTHTHTHTRAHTHTHIHTRVHTHMHTHTTHNQCSNITSEHRPDMGQVQSTSTPNRVLKIHKYKYSCTWPMSGMIHEYLLVISCLCFIY